MVLAALKRYIPDAALRRYHFLVAFFAALRYGFPSRRLAVIGVTGTDGKTTTVHLLHEMLAASGHRVGSLSSLRFNINGREEPNLLQMTMPGRFRLQQFLAECRSGRCRFAIIEVTSQGILQSRHRFIRFCAAVLTNVTPEHVEAHGGFERYREAKMELFRGLPASGTAVLNREDPSAELFAAGTRADIVWYSRTDIELGRVGHPVRIAAAERDRMLLELDGRFFEAPLGGEFNIMNMLAAAATALAFRVSLSAIAAGLDRIGGVPGRLEYIQREPFSVVVDYANTPAAYARVYQALAGGNSIPPEAGQIPRPTSPGRSPGGRANSKLICILGAPGGGRDKWKRPEIGKIAERYCREVILTGDDSDDEDPAAIAADIRRGIAAERAASVKIILDRRSAIRAGLGAARPGDTVIITGMGAQPWLVIKGMKTPWDDRQVVREELVRLTS